MTLPSGERVKLFHARVASGVSLIIDIIPASHYDEAVAAREAAKKARALPRRVLRRAVEEAEAEAEAALEAEADQLEAGDSTGLAAGPSGGRKTGIPKSCETRSTGDYQGCGHRDLERKCPECNEAVRCPHGKTRTGRYRYKGHCIRCTPSAACKCKKLRSTCTACNPSKACQCPNKKDRNGNPKRRSDCVDCSPHLRCWDCDDPHSNPHTRSRCRVRAGSQEKKRREKRKAKK